MKNKNIAKIFVLILSLALLIGTVAGISVSADDSTGEILQSSIVHNDKIQIAFKVNATEADVMSEKVVLKYTWSGSEEEKTAAVRTVGSADGAYIFVTEGVAAYELAKVVTATTYIDGVEADTKTYSVAQFLYAMLYRDGVTGATADCYEALLEYGAASQIALNQNTDALVTDCTVVYTSVKGATIDGTNSYYFALPGTEFTVAPTCTGATNWKLTGASNCQFLPGSSKTVTGIVSVTPNFSASNFESAVTEGVNFYTFAGTSYTAHVEQTAISTDSSAETYYGVLGKLVVDPLDAANQVLSVVVNGGVNNSATSVGSDTKYYSNIKFAPASATESGKIHVFEFDINLQHANKAVDDPFNLVAYSEDGTKIGEIWPSGSYDSTVRFDYVTTQSTEAFTNVYHFGNEYSQSAESDSTSLLNAQEWYRVRITWDQTNSKLYYDVSVDGGETWYILTADKSAVTSYASSDVAYLGFQFNCYQLGYSVLFDNIDYTIVDSVPTRVDTIFNDATEAAARQ